MSTPLFQRFPPFSNLIFICLALTLLVGWQPEPAAAQTGDTWLIMMYQDADDSTLEKDIFTDLNEAEIIGSTAQVHIVAQLDRFEGSFDGDGDWTSTKRYYITQDDDLETINSEEIVDLGEANMADMQTLVDFIVWAVESYPADKHVLILSDHGMGWPGGWSDPDPGEFGRHTIPIAEMFGEDHLYLMEIDEALAAARAETGLDQFEMIGFDACLMSHIEVMSAIAPHARYAVASQETEPALGWAYASFLGQLADNPAIDGGELAYAIVTSYIEQDQRIVDDAARTEFVLESFGFEGDSTPQEVAEAMSEDITLTAVDLSALPVVIQALDNLLQVATQLDQSLVAEARAYAQSYTSVFGDDVPPSYIDLAHFSLMLSELSGSPEVTAAVNQLGTAFGRAIIAEKHGPQRPGSNGLSIYFPNSELYGNWAVGHDSYATVSNRFAAESLWDDFLLYHYTGTALPETTTAPTPVPTATPSPEVTPPAAPATPASPTPTPTPSLDIQAPGAGIIELTELEFSADYTTLDEPVIIQTTISGEQIGFIYFYAGYYDEESNAIAVADYDFVAADDIKEINGVYYPDWGDEGLIEMEFEWAPEIYVISDGLTEEFAVLEPEDYGASAEEGVYTVSGIYTFAESGEERYAVLYFDGEGQFTEVYGYTGENGTGAPRQISPQAGDQFTIFEQWIDLNEEGEEDGFTEEEGGTLTFGEQPFEWYAVPAPAGYYEVGFIVEDLDGNFNEAYGEVEVLEVE